MMESWIPRYVARIGYEGPLEPTWECLQKLHRRHLFTVPFEDLDIHLGRPLALHQDALIEKVINSRRGGFCYELNYLFALFLEQIGFQVQLLAAQVYAEDGTWGPYYDHLALKVNQRWLADVGFGGGSYISPLVLEESGYQTDKAGVYLIKTAELKDQFQIWRAHTIEDEFNPLYQFDLQVQDIENFQQECQSKQVDPGSHFVNNKICTMAFDGGRYSLHNNSFIQRNGSQKETIVIRDQAMERDILKKYFNITL